VISLKKIEMRIWGDTMMVENIENEKSVERM
jgi:hypothetical protein